MSNILRVVSRQAWGADRTVLLRLYRALIRSKVDYGCQAYGSASNSNLKLLDPISRVNLWLDLKQIANKGFSLGY